jgi:F0F1-type ATP synthase delta subunit
MRLSIPQYAEVLLELEKEGDVAVITSRFSEWLSRRGEWKKLKKIVKEADRIVREKSGITDVTITTAHEADEATKDGLISQAKEVFAEDSVEARFVVDASVIGGVRLRSDETLYDATLSNAVRKLRIALMK